MNTTEKIKAALKIKNKRYIRGTINKKIENAIRSRDTGDKTTDPIIRAAVLKKTKGLCYMCYRRYTTNADLALRVPSVYFSNLQIDHVVPFSKGGPNATYNYMPICGRCNALKSDRSIGETKTKLAKIKQRS